MFGYIWPLALVVLSNIFYQICTKGVPEDVSPFASLAVTYLVGAAVSVLLFFITDPRRNLIGEFAKTNWTSVLLGAVIVGLETGYIYAYKAGWPVSTAPIVQSAVLSIALIFVGAMLYREAITWNKLAGIAICLIGLVVTNMK